MVQRALQNLDGALCRREEQVQGRSGRFHAAAQTVEDAVRERLPAAAEPRLFFQR